MSDGYWLLNFKELGVGKEEILSATLEEFRDWDEYFSPKLRSQLGCTNQPNKASIWVDAIYPDDLKTAYGNFAKHISSNGQYPYTQDVRYRTYDGKHIKVLCAGESTWIEGKILSMSGIHKLLEVSETEIK